MSTRDAHSKKKKELVRHFFLEMQIALYFSVYFHFFKIFFPFLINCPIALHYARFSITGLYLSRLHFFFLELRVKWHHAQRQRPIKIFSLTPSASHASVSRALGCKLSRSNLT